MEFKDLKNFVGEVTSNAAISCYKWIGKGEKESADAAAVKSMRETLNLLKIDGTVVIGEGERDEAPMLYIGEKIGLESSSLKIDIALDPLEGTTLCANSAPNSLTVIAFAKKGHFLNAPDVYMDKIATGPDVPDGVINLDKSPEENMKSVAKSLNKDVTEMTICVLKRERHDYIVKDARRLGCKVVFIDDGDVQGIMACSMKETSIDMYMGQGGSPEGVLAAAAQKCLGGRMQAKLHFRNDDEIKRARSWGIKDLNKKYSSDELASGDVVFSASGVTDGSLLDGVKKTSKGYITETLVLDSITKSKQIIKKETFKK